MYLNSYIVFYRYDIIALQYDSAIFVSTVPIMKLHNVEYDMIASSSFGPHLLNTCTMWRCTVPTVVKMG